VGYRENTIGHGVYDPIANTVIRTRYCRVKEEKKFLQTRGHLVEKCYGAEYQTLKEQDCFEIIFHDK
jgi:hypothetical protein